MAKESKVISNLINVCNEKKTFVIEDAVFIKMYLLIKLVSVVEIKVIQNVKPDKNTGIQSENTTPYTIYRDVNHKEINLLLYAFKAISRVLKFFSMCS